MEIPKDKFNINVVKRTIQILNDYDGPYDMCNLINCTLGLIILPCENIKRKGSLIPGVWDLDYDRILGLPPFDLKLFNPLKFDFDKSIVEDHKTLNVLLQKIRNGLAHQHISPVNHGGEFDYINIWNEFEGITDLRIGFSQIQLMNFAMFIANEYLRTSS